MIPDNKDFSNYKLNILMAPFSIFLSHVLRCLSIADSLRKRGHNVFFIACCKYEYLINGEGFSVIHCDHNLISNLMFCGSPHQYKIKHNIKTVNYKNSLKAIMLQEMEIIDIYKPDIVITDGDLSMLAAFLINNFPMIEVRNHAGLLHEAVGHKNESHSIFDTHEINNLTTNITDAISECGIKLSEHSLDKYLLIPIMVPGIESFEVIDKVNYFESREHKFIGPLTWNHWNDSRPIEIAHDSKVILLSFGSSFPCQAIIETVCSVFDKSGYYLIVNARMDKMKAYKKNIVFREYLNFDEVLPYVNLIISHSGHGTVMHALKFGIPNLVIPFNGDQYEISRHIEELKLGLRITKYPLDITSEEISIYAEKILNNNVFKHNATLMARELNNLSNPAFAAALFIEDYYSRYLDNNTSIN